jgi:SsrA-binding protein
LARKVRDRAETPLLATNRAASHEYHLLERFEAGIALTGTEVKSAREARVSLKEAYARIDGGEAFLHDAHFSPYSQGGRDNPDPVRTRKLLLHAAEIRKLARATEAGGMTLVPTRLFLKGGRIKIEIALARGKKTYDKRAASRREEAEREMARLRGRIRE